MSAPLSLEQLKYPIGEYVVPEQFSAEQVKNWIGELATFPIKLKEKVTGLSEEELNWRYRPEGWSIRQVVHHCADSHINSLVRFKLALTEDKPTIKPYREERWALLADVSQGTLDDAYSILTGVHRKLELLLSSLSEEQWYRTFLHPDFPEPQTVVGTIGNYAWHSNHHLAHISQALHYQGAFGSEN